MAIISKNNFSSAAEEVLRVQHKHWNHPQLSRLVYKQHTEQYTLTPIVSQISWKSCSSSLSLRLQICLQHAILTIRSCPAPSSAAAGILLHYWQVCVCVCARAVVMHEPTAAAGMWRGSSAGRSHLLGERLVISCLEDRIWHLFNLGKVGVCTCLCVHWCAGSPA